MYWTGSKISKHCKENWDVCKAVFSNRPFQGFDRRNDEKAAAYPVCRLPVYYIEGQRIVRIMYIMLNYCQSPQPNDFVGFVGRRTKVVFGNGGKKCRLNPRIQTVLHYGPVFLNHFVSGFKSSLQWGLSNLAFRWHSQLPVYRIDTVPAQIAVCL